MAGSTPTNIPHRNRLRVLSLRSPYTKRISSRPVSPFANARNKSARSEIAPGLRRIRTLSHLGMPMSEPCGFGTALRRPFVEPRINELMSGSSKAFLHAAKTHNFPLADHLSAISIHFGSRGPPRNEPDPGNSPEIPERADSSTK